MAKQYKTIRGGSNPAPQLIMKPTIDLLCLKEIQRLIKHYIEVCGVVCATSVIIGSHKGPVEYQVAFRIRDDKADKVEVLITTPEGAEVELAYRIQITLEEDT